jgi:surface antigen
MQLNRRKFLGALAVAAAANESDAQTVPSSWGGPVLDCHLHLREDGERNIVEAMLRASTSPRVFREITWTNGHALFNIPAA